MKRDSQRELRGKERDEEKKTREERAKCCLWDKKLVCESKEK